MGLKSYIRNWFRHDRNVKRMLKEIKFDQENLMEQMKKMQEYQRVYYLQDKALHCTDKGVSQSMLCDEEVIVSLTSYGARINEVYLAIESIMQGSVLPNRIVLWLSEEERNRDLPITLLNQSHRGLQIEYCHDIRSYNKLIPTLKKFTDACVITIDDDVMYTYDFVENLVKTHNHYPKAVCANRIHKIVLGKDGKPVSYMDWDYCTSDYSNSKLNFLTGVGGVLYPPHVFPDEVFNESVFVDICKFADDIWFFAMLLKNGKSVIKSFTHASNGEDFVAIGHPQGVALSSSNVNPSDCQNDVQLKAVFERYNLYPLLQGCKASL